VVYLKTMSSQLASAWWDRATTKSLVRMWESTSTFWKQGHNVTGTQTFFFLIRIVGGGIQIGPLGTSATEWPIVPALGDYYDGEFVGMKIGRGNRSTWRKTAQAQLWPPQNPLDQTWNRTLAAAVRSQRLTAWAMARPTQFTLRRNAMKSRSDGAPSLADWKFRSFWSSGYLSSEELLCKRV
jgi:hypothetical protein